MGTNAAVTPLGRPEAAKLTLPVKPPTSPTVIVLVPLLPWATLKAPGKTDSVKPLPLPVPVSAMSSGLGLALLATVSAPTADPTIVGENWTSIVQFLPASSVPPVSEQVVPLSWILKSPEGTTLLKVTALALLLVILTAFAVLVESTACDAKVRLAGATVNAVTEVPVRLITCGLLALGELTGIAADPSILPTNVG